MAEQPSTSDKPQDTQGTKSTEAPPQSDARAATSTEARQQSNAKGTNSTEERPQANAKSTKAAKSAKSIKARPQRRRRRRPPVRVQEIDGFRALAILAVVCYHLDVPWLPSGHLGVVMFLVLTGYLATSSLLLHQRSGFKSLLTFWKKRLHRIWLPAAVMMSFTLLACIAFNHVLLTKARPDVLPGLALVENINYILRDISYFDRIGGPSPLKHLWYLGIDAQFCLVWPLLMYGLSKLLPRPTTRRVTLVLAAASAVAMALLYNHGAGLIRIYYGTDTRAFAPLLGAWLAFAAPVGRRPARDIRPLFEKGRLAIELMAIASLVATAVAMVLVRDTASALYQGGMFVVAALSTVVILALNLPGGILSRVLSFAPLTWLGTRSYGIYLWHFPLILLLGANSKAAAWWKLPAALVLTVVLAELSHRYVERPASSGRLLPKLKRRLSQGVAGLRSPIVMGTFALILVAVVDGVGLATVPDQTLVPQDAVVSTGDAADRAMDLSARQQEEPTDIGEVPPAEAVLHAPASEKEAGVYDPVLIGDSVPGDAESYWRAACPDGLLDSYVGRTPEQAAAVLNEYLSQGVVGKIVIMQAFSNTPVSLEQLNYMVDACGEDRSIYFVNVRSSSNDMDQINDTIQQCVDSHSNVHLIDWHGASEGHGEDWLYADGEHLAPGGQDAYIDTIVDAIYEEFADIGGSITSRNSYDNSTATGKSIVVSHVPEEENTEEQTEEEDDSPLRILMLGNSLTYYNDMPAILSELTGAEVEAHTKGGAHLAEQLDPNSQIGSSTLAALEEGGWDYVVLQEQSAQPIKTDEGEYMQSLTELTERVRACGATPIIYATWPYAEGCSRLDKLGISSDEMGKLLHSAFVEAAASTGDLMADVESAWQNAEAREMLYAVDGVHPSAIGSRLAAEVIAQTIEQDQSAKE
ncbi:MAG: acyltransferase family protein [Atopobiaceae bacterium]|nr:acyltransferase family protein [Atopobiaceae bacterium]